MKEKVVNTARRRKRRVLAADFNKAARYFEDMPDRDVRKHWKKSIPLMPVDAMKILTRGLPRNIKITFELDEDGDGCINFYGPGINQVNADFKLKQKVRHSGYTKMEDDAQSRKIATNIIRNQIEFLHACGVRRFEVTASSTVGGYAWARFGYRPADRDEANKVREKISNRFRAIEAILTEEEREAIRRILAKKNVRYLWEIADLRTDIAPRLKDVFNKSANPDVPPDESLKALDIESRMNQAVTENNSNNAPNFQRLVEERPQITLGQYFLLGLAWDGVINLDDPVQMKRVANYVGGFKYLKFKQ